MKRAPKLVWRLLLELEACHSLLRVEQMVYLHNLKTRRKAAALVVVQAQSMLTELLPQNSILLSQILDYLQLSLIHPPGNGHKQELEGIEILGICPTDCRSPRRQILTTSRFSSSYVRTKRA
jgi:hypothetical protein